MRTLRFMRRLSLATLIFAAGFACAEPAMAQQGGSTPPLPQVVEGPTDDSAPPANDQPRQHGRAAPGTQTGSRCQAVLLALHRAMICQLRVPLPLRAGCQCPFGPIPYGHHGMVPSAPALGIVIP